ncbi:MobF family relaxase [Kitasatospora sp. NPDC096128]|uniref:MobF family relaxase n=1 Tax=Kitasatospora sp. NPDC096128 TaxID=3155547 RepID=UPI003323B6C8
MTVDTGRLTAGDGWRYFARQIATGDELRVGGRDLAEHQRTAGIPPGRWVGRAATVLGVAGTVTEPQMRALYGEGLHPRAEEITAERLRAGDSARKAVRAARLGAAYYQFGSTPTELATAIQGKIAALEARTGRAATAKEQQQARWSEGARAFRAEYRRDPKNGAELGRYIARQLRPARQPVAAWHPVFRPPSSVDQLWALGDESVRAAVEQAHDEAIAITLAWIEDHALATRSGKGGIAQQDVPGGLVAAQFRHFDNRCGQALLHDHVLIANRVQAADGRWRTIDGRLLLAQMVAASELYNEEVLRRICTRLDLAVEERIPAPGRRPVMEIAGVDPALYGADGVRARAIRERLEQLADDYRQRHGRQPDAKTRIALMDQAARQTRPAKKQARPLHTLLRIWRHQAVEAAGEQRVDDLLTTARTAARNLHGDQSPPELDLYLAARDVVGAVSRHRAVFSRRHILAEARRYTTRTTRGRGGQGWAERITDHALARVCVDLTPPDINPPFAPLARPDGTSIYRHRQGELYTTRALLAAEDRIVAAARARIPAACDHATFTRVLERHQGPLDAGQRAMAEAFATADRRLVAAIGPAGAGKTTAMRLATAAITAAGRRVIALAPSARAAHVLGTEIGHDAHTLHLWLRRQKLADHGRLVLPHGERLRPGDVVLVDEAGMAATLDLAQITARAKDAGAHVRLIGDPSQLAAVESGGALRLLQTEVGALHLTAVHRFRTRGEADASLALRDGTPHTAFTWYREHGRVAGGTTTDMLDAVFTAWRTDLDAGHHTLMMAPDRDLVARLNTRAQAHRLARGDIRPARLKPAARLRDGHLAHPGDLIVTRRNQRTLVCRGGKDFVKNGDVWCLAGYTRRGDAIVRHTGHHGRLTLPADYLTEHCELGYASTIHRAQGMTVERSHALLTARTTREAAYVAATRGRAGNRLYIALEDDQDLGRVLERIAAHSAYSKSARQSLREEQQRAWGIVQLAAEYQDAAQRADELRYRAAAHQTLGPAAARLDYDGAFTAVAGALARAEQAGFTPARILAAAHAEGTLTGADVPGAALAWRIDRRVKAARAAEAQADADPHPNRRLLRALDDAQLERLAALAADHRARALTELHAADAQLASQPKPVTAHGRRHAPWPERPHGPLTAPDLAHRLAATRRTARRAADEGDHRTELTAAHTLAGLRDEHRLRRAMPWRDRAREDYQRRQGHSPAHSADPPAAAREHLHRARRRTEAAHHAWQRADAVTARIHAERRLRHRLPDHRAHTKPGGDLPHWLTPTAALADHLTPARWRHHLTERRDIIDRHLAARGAQLAADTPPWARPLGPLPPAQAGAALRADWERTAALLDAWRAVNSVPDTTPGLGPRPEDPLQGAAYDSLEQRIHTLRHRIRTAHQHRHFGPGDLARQALAHLARLHLLRAAAAPHPDAPPRPADRQPAPAAGPARLPAVQPLLPQAERLALAALAAALTDTAAPEEWVEQIPAPDEDDTAQQHLYQRLVAAIADYRIRLGITDPHPLGPAREDHTADERQHLARALDLYQRARIDDRLHLLRLRREADRQRLQAAAQQAATACPAPARPARPGSPGRPRRPGPRRRR